MVKPARDEHEREMVTDIIMNIFYIFLESRLICC